MKREARLQGILRISQKPNLSGSTVKGASLKVPLMESVVERRPTTRVLLHSSKSPVHELLGLLYQHFTPFPKQFDTTNLT